jgi:hypothetical protein
MLTVGLSLAARPENLSAAAVAKESASTRVLRILTVCILHVWYSPAGIRELLAGAAASANAQFTPRTAKCVARSTNTLKLRFTKAYLIIKCGCDYRS